ncbi:hypothetical protein ANCCAN_13227 [Ancylostoma caninum]|uniref:MULE transposase domain-containing protein n=1 Tax=Ancylostoma caninum TaxID=29170 RepID=A0A368G8U3_ANCCA|nr:hypothetical protein ANCCAN_13227 [Ancylostoma caninum]
MIKEKYFAEELHMRDELGAAVPPRLRVVLDYEKPAINAVKRVFPHATVQGCAFHLAQAWNRRGDRLGLRRFIKGAVDMAKSLEVEEWWFTIKGLVYLPRRLHREDPSHTKHIRRKDREHRERVAHKMSSFNTNYQAGVSRMAVDEYCSYMARFVAESAV